MSETAVWFGATVGLIGLAVGIVVGILVTLGVTIIIGRVISDEEDPD